MKNMIFAVFLVVALLSGRPSGALVQLTGDIRITFMGPFTGPYNDEDYDAGTPAIVYNPVADGYLVVWSSDEETPGPSNPPMQVDEEFEIFAQRLGSDGDSVGSEFLVSKMGVPGDPDTDAIGPQIAVDTANNRYLVTWIGEDGVPDDTEVYGRLFTADGMPLTASNTTVSSMGAPADTNAGVLAAKPAYNSQDQRYLVVWVGDDDANPFLTSQFNIYGQFLDADGSEEGADDFIIYSSPAAAFETAPFSLDVVYNPQRNEFVVVFAGADDATLDREIFALRVDANGSSVGEAVRISRMGPDGQDGDYFPMAAAVAFNPNLAEYLVVWSSTDDRFPLDPGQENEIFGQRLNGDLAEVGEDDFRISDMGIDGISDFDARNPQIAYNPLDREYLVTWTGDAFDPYLTDGETEIYAQFLDEEGVEIGFNDVRISDIGPLGDAGYGTQTQLAPLAHSPVTNRYIAVWSADESRDLINAQVLGEYEIFKQTLASHLCNDGIVELYEECDDGAGNSDTVADACRTDCALAACGDGVTDTKEECDGGAECGDDCRLVVAGSGTGEGTGGTSGEEAEDSGSSGGCSLVR